MEKDKSRDYKISNKHETVKLSRFVKKYSQMILTSTEDVKVRQKRSQELMDYLCEKYGISPVEVHVSSSKRPSKGRGQIYGYYMVNQKKIVLYNITPKTGQPVAIKTFFDTLIHEFIHHYDYHVLKLNDSMHTLGFYKRIDDLKKKLV